MAKLEVKRFMAKRKRKGLWRTLKSLLIPPMFSKLRMCFQKMVIEA